MLKRLYYDFFYISEHEKIKENVFITRISVSISVIVFCMVAMSLSAYAFFTSSISSGNSVVTAANYAIEVTPTESLPEPVDGVYAVDNSQGELDVICSFVLSRASDATATTGYCRVSVLTDVPVHQEYFTKNIGSVLENDVLIPNKQRTVSILVKAGKTAKVSFTAEWGTCNDNLVFDETSVIIPQFGS